MLGGICCSMTSISMPCSGTIPLCSHKPVYCMQAWHKKTLQGRLVLQIDELSNIATPIRERSAL